VHDLESGSAADPNGLFRAVRRRRWSRRRWCSSSWRRERQTRRPVRDYLPDLVPAAYETVTVRQLLNHTSGIPAADLPGDNFEEVYAHRFDLHTPQEMLASATAKEREFVPGTQQHYLNINYTVLALLVERLTVTRTSRKRHADLRTAGDAAHVLPRHRPDHQRAAQPRLPERPARRRHDRAA